MEDPLAGSGQCTGRGEKHSDSKDVSIRSTIFQGIMLILTVTYRVPP